MKKRIVLGVGYPWFWKTAKDRLGYQTVRLYANSTEGYAKKLQIGNLANDVRIRLVAEIITHRKTKKPSPKSGGR